jgi:hypothetical protein
MVNERLTGSTYSLSNLSLPSIGWLTIVVTETCIVKVWTSKGMIYKHVAPLSGLTSLVICLPQMVLLELIGSNFRIYKIRGFILEIRKSGLIGLQLKLITLFIQTS